MQQLVNSFPRSALSTPRAHGFQSAELMGDILDVDVDVDVFRCENMVWQTKACLRLSCNPYWLLIYRGAGLILPPTLVVTGLECAAEVLAKVIDAQ